MGEKYGSVEERQCEMTKRQVEELRNDNLSDDDIIDYFEKANQKYEQYGSARGRDLDRLQAIREKNQKKKQPVTVEQSTEEQEVKSEEEIIAEQEKAAIVAKEKAEQEAKEKAKAEKEKVIAKKEKAKAEKE